MKDLRTRADIHYLVCTFYAKIRIDELLGPIFKNHIPEDSWDFHLEHITDFWESSVFLSGNYKGNPLTVHQKVDAAENYSITEYHFGIWLNYWVQTIDELYKGKNANKLKMRARKMASHLHINLFMNKSKKQ